MHFVRRFVREPSDIVVCTEFCSKGSLQDVLEDDDLKLDNMFIASLVMDLVKGECSLFWHKEMGNGNEVKIGVYKNKGNK